MDDVERAAATWSELRPDFETSPMLVVGRVQRLWDLWDEALRPSFEQAGLNPGDFDVLAALRRSAVPVAPGEVARSMLVTAGATTKRVDRLQELGLVERVASETDGRQRLVVITARGREVADELMERHLENQARLLAPLSGQDRAVLGRFLAQLLAHASA